MSKAIPQKEINEINDLKNALYDSKTGKLIKTYESSSEVEQLKSLKTIISKLIEQYGIGWERDLPDNRDSIALKIELPSELIPPNIDLSKEFGSVENQNGLNSCTACAVVGLVEFFEKKLSGQSLDLSVLFLYKIARKLIKHPTAPASFLKDEIIQTIDSGASLRITFRAMNRLGLPLDTQWPYVTDNVDVEPSADCYEHNQKYDTLSYFRLDSPEITKEDLLVQIKTCLAAGFPSVFGFTVFDSIIQAETTGKIAYPTDADSPLGGHAMLAVGYDNSLEILNTNPGAQKTKGALLVRNSWGREWGNKGYGWLPYDYVKHDLAVDWWSLKDESGRLGEFGIKLENGGMLKNLQGEILGIPVIKHKS